MTPDIQIRTRIMAVVFAVLATCAVARAQSVDPTFNPGVSGYVYALAVQADGKIMVGGTFYKLGGGGTGTTTRNSLGRLNTDGSVDMTFDPDVYYSALSEATVGALALQADGKILVGGSFTGLGGQPGLYNPRHLPRKNIARLNADGSFDTSFDPGAGGTAFGGVTALVVQADGKIVVGGGFTALGGGGAGTTTRNYIGRLNADGTLDTDFNPGANGNVTALAVQADSRSIIQTFCDSVLGFSISLGAIQKVLDRVSRAIEPAFL